MRGIIIRWQFWLWLCLAIIAAGVMLWALNNPNLYAITYWAAQQTNAQQIAYDVQQGQRVILRDYPEGSVPSPDGTQALQISSSRGESTLVLYDVPSGVSRELGTYDFSTSTSWIDWSTDDNTLVLVGSQGRAGYVVVRLNLATGIAETLATYDNLLTVSRISSKHNLVYSLENNNPTRPLQLDNYITGERLTLENFRIFTFDDDRYMAYVRHIDGHSDLLRINLETFAVEAEDLSAISDMLDITGVTWLTPDETLLVTDASTEAGYVVDVRLNTVTKLFDSEINLRAISETGESIVGAYTAREDGDAEVKERWVIFDIATGEQRPLMTINLNSNVVSVQFSPDGEQVMLVYTTTDINARFRLEIFRVDTGERVHSEGISSADVVPQANQPVFDWLGNA
jgi:hypothetical protein